MMATALVMLLMMMRDSIDGSDGIGDVVGTIDCDDLDDDGRNGHVDLFTSIQTTVPQAIVHVLC